MVSGEIKWEVGGIGRERYSPCRNRAVSRSSIAGFSILCPQTRLLLFLRPSPSLSVPLSLSPPLIYLSSTRKDDLHSPIPTSKSKSFPRKRGLFQLVDGFPPSLPRSLPVVISLQKPSLYPFFDRPEANISLVVSKSLILTDGRIVFFLLVRRGQLNLKWA